MKNSFLAFFCFIFLANTIHAQSVPNGLDETFNDGGYTINNVGGSFTKHLVLADGSIIQMGSFDYSDGGKDGYLTKLNPDGSVNEDFNTLNSGVKNVLMFRGSEYSAFAQLISQNDGKIIVGGSTQYDELFEQTQTTVSYTDIALARLLPNGNPDNTFGIGGKVILTFGKGTNKITDMSMTASGKVLISGEYKDAVTLQKQIFVIRLLSNGTIDNSFGTDGKWTSDQIVNSFNTQIEVDANGNILLASNVGFTTLVVAKLSADGVLIQSFGTNGISSISILEPVYGSRAQMFDMILDKNGDLYFSTVMSSTNITSYSRGVLFKLNNTGLLDQSFGTNGNFKFANDAAYAIDFTHDGKIAVVGRHPEGTPYLYIINKNGTIDSSPDYNYETATQSFSTTNTSVRLDDVTCLPNGRIVATGSVITKADPLKSKGISIRFVKVTPKPGNCSYQNKIVSYHYSIYGICKDPQGNIFTNDNNRMLKYNASGTIIQTWKIRGASALASDKDGNIYAVSSDSIYKYSNTGILLKAWGGSGSENGRFNGATDIAIDTDGNIFISDTDNNRIQKFDANGNYVLQWNSHETETPALSYMKALTVDKVNNIYVGGGGGAKTSIIQKFNSSGVWLETFNLTDEFCKTIAISPIDQSIYVGGFGFSIYNSEGIFQKKIESNAENFNVIPEKMYINTDGSFMATWPGYYQIQFYSAQNTFDTFWSGLPADNNGRYTFTSTYAADKAGNVYVADSKLQIIKFTAQGAYIKKWGGEGSGESQFKSIIFMAVTNTSLIYVIDSVDAVVKCFDTDGKFIRKWGSKGKGNGQFNKPYQVTIDNNNFVYVFDQGNCRIQKFTPDGTFILEWGSCEMDEENFQYSNTLMSDSKNNIYVSDSWSGKIKKFSSSGIFIQTITLNNYPGNPDNGSKICMSGDNFFAVHPVNFLLRRFDAEGAFISACNYTAPYSDNISAPMNLYMSSTGTAYIHDIATQSIVSVQNTVTPTPTSLQKPNSTVNEQVACLVFPNPTTGLFTIKSADEIDHVLVYDITGVSETFYTAEINTHLKGLLMIKVFMKNGTVQNSKVVKM